MSKTSKDQDEVRLEKLGKSLLAMPSKPREDTKFAKKKTVKAKTKKAEAIKPRAP